MAVNGTTLTPTQKRALAGPALSSQLTPDDRLYRDYADFSRVYEWPDLDLRAMREMLSHDGNPRKLEQVLTLPIRGANWELRGSGPAMGLVRDDLEHRLGEVIAACTSAIANRKAFFELTWRLDGGRVVHDEIGPRPAVSCEAAFRDADGRPDGFRQQLAPITQHAMRTSDMGWVRVPPQRAFIYVHGTHREPLRGTSDLDVCLYCWDNIRKLQFLWCQFLEQQSLPKVLVYGDDPTQARGNAQAVADANASATIPMERRGDPMQKTFEVLESSGKGASQFKEALAYWEAKQTQSVLAGFMDLAEAAASGLGSYALSADQSEFFLASRQAIADEIAQQITDKLIRPLAVYNYGADVEVPLIRIGPIGNRQTDRALALLGDIISASTVNAPPEFTGFLLTHTATFLGLDAGEVADAVQRWSEQQQAQAQQPTGQSPPGPPMADEPRPGTAQAGEAAQMSAAIGFAADLVQQAQAGIDPKDALRGVRAPYGRRKRRR